MKLEGSYKFRAPRSAVWERFIDPATLRDCLPGCQRLDEQEPGVFAAIMKIGIGPISGTYTGTVRLSNPIPPVRYTLGVDGGGGPGVIRGEGTFVFADDAAGGTLLTYDGDVHIAGTLAAVGQRVFAPATKMIIGQFFRCMDGKLSEQRSSPSTTEEVKG